MTKRSATRQSKTAYTMARPRGGATSQRRRQTKSPPPPAPRKIGPALHAAARSATGQQLLSLALILSAW